MNMRCFAMTNFIWFLLVVWLGWIAVGCSRHPTGPNQVLFDYLGEPVLPPANLDAAYTKEGLTAAMQDAAQAANIPLMKIEIDDSEFPCLVGVVCENKGDMPKLKEQIGRNKAYNYAGGVGGDKVMVMNLVPFTAFPNGTHERIYHRMMLREAVLSDKLHGSK